MIDIVDRHDEIDPHFHSFVMILGAAAANDVYTGALQPEFYDF
jgi:hypothetical protein